MRLDGTEPCMADGLRLAAPLEAAGSAFPKPGCETQEDRQPPPKRIRRKVDSLAPAPPWLPPSPSSRSPSVAPQHCLFASKVSTSTSRRERSRHRSSFEIYEPSSSDEDDEWPSRGSASSRFSDAETTGENTMRRTPPASSALRRPPLRPLVLQPPDTSIAGTSHNPRSRCFNAHALLSPIPLPPSPLRNSSSTALSDSSAELALELADLDMDDSLPAGLAPPPDSASGTTDASDCEGRSKALSHHAEDASGSSWLDAGRHFGDYGAAP